MKIVKQERGAMHGSVLHCTVFRYFTTDGGVPSNGQ